MLWLTVSN